MMMRKTAILYFVVMVILQARADQKTPPATSSMNNADEIDCDKNNEIESKTESSACPCLCSCGGGGTELRCTGGRFSIPSNASKTVRSFIYSNNKLPNNTLTFGALAAFQHATLMILSSNSICVVESDAFDLCRNLTYLVLDNNQFVSSNVQPFLGPSATSLEFLSLRSVVASHEESASLWRLFNLLLSKETHHSSESERRFGNTFPSLRTLKLDGNFLTNINATNLKQALRWSCLRYFSLSHNWLQSDSMEVVLTLLDGCEQRINVKNISKNKSLAEIPLIEEASFSSTDVDMTFNNITGLEASFIKALKDRYLGDQPVSPYEIQRKLTFKLKENNFICNCSINETMCFLFKDKGKMIITDWKKLTCHQPDKVAGLELQQLFDFRINYCAQKASNFKFSAPQLAFIVIFGAILGVVSVMVVYLNRYKILSYCRVVRHCGEADEHETSVKWRGNISKYQIPEDHRGVGQISYFSEEQKLTFGTESEKDVKHT